jgi:hypothetical protein
LFVALPESRAVVVLVGITRAVGSVVAVVAVAIVAVANRVIAITVAPVVVAMLPAVAVSTCERRILISAKNPRVATVVTSALREDRAIPAVPVAIAGREAAPELVAIHVTAAVPVLISAVTVAVHRVALDVRVATLAPVLLALLNTFSVAPVIAASKALRTHQ